MSKANLNIENKIIKNLKQFLGNKYKAFNNALIQSNAVIAGGSILSLLHDGIINDIDVYVNLEHLTPLLIFLRDNNYINQMYNAYTTPPYDKSFLKENGVIVRYPFLYVPNNNHNPYIYGPEEFLPEDNLRDDNQHIRNRIMIDLIVIRNDKLITDVTTNFDLTFCEIWYDGKNVKSNTINDSLNKTGMINEAYLKKLREMNQFTILRIKKYINRGYKITNLTADDFILMENYINDFVRENVEYNQYIKSKVYVDKIITNQYRPFIEMDSIISNNDNYTILKLYSTLIRFNDIKYYIYYDIFNNYLNGFIIKLNEINDILYRDYPYKKFTYGLSLLNYFNQFDTNSSDINMFNDMLLSLNVQRDNLHYLYTVLLLSTNMVKSCEFHPELTCSTNINIIVDTCNKVLSDGHKLNIKYIQSLNKMIDISDYKYVNKIIISVDETIFPENCFDIYMTTYNKITDILDDNNYILLINYNKETGIDDVLCIERDSMLEILTKLDHQDVDETFYECTGNVIQGTNDKRISFDDNKAYGKFPINNQGLNGLFDNNNIRDILYIIHNTDNRILYILPVYNDPYDDNHNDDDNVQLIFTHTISKRNTLPNIANYISTNHCQAGSNFLVYRFGICADLEKCVKTMMTWNLL